MSLTPSPILHHGKRRMRSVSGSMDLESEHEEERQDPTLDTAERGGQSPVPIYVSLRGTDDAHRAPSLLSRLFGLAVWGPSLLNMRARHEMNAAATLLGVVFIFELLAWTLLFNVILHAARWEMSVRSLLAALLAMMFASVVFLYERSFITTDLLASGGRKLAAAMLRLVVIGATALATAQPLELLVFGQEIDARLKEEGIWTEALRQLELLEQDRKDSEAPIPAEVEERLKGTTQQRDLEAATASVAARTDELTSADTGVATALQALERAKNSLRRAHEVLNSLGVRYSAGQLAQAESRVRRATDLRNLKSGELEAARQRQTSATIALDRAKKEEDRARKDWLALVEKEVNIDYKGAQQAELSLNTRKSWIDEIQLAPVGKAITSPLDRHQNWDPYQAGFITRLSILDDLLKARRPAWPSSERAKRLQVVSTFGLPDPEALDEPTRERDELRAAALNKVYRISFIIAVVIPLLTIAFKLLMARELSIYYSTKAQARAGNPQAIQTLVAQLETD